MGLKDPVITLPPLPLGPRDSAPTPFTKIHTHVDSNQTGLAMSPTLIDLASGSCLDNSTPTVRAAVHQAALPPQNLNIPFRTTEWNGPVAGRLSRLIKNWKMITADPGAEHYTRLSHRVLQQPWLHQLPTMHYSNQERLDISKEVTKMQEEGAVVPVRQSTQQECFTSNLFLVPKKDGHETGDKPRVSTN